MKLRHIKKSLHAVRWYCGPSDMSAGWGAQQYRYWDNNRHLSWRFR